MCYCLPTLGAALCCGRAKCIELCKSHHRPQTDLQCAHCAPFEGQPTLPATIVSNVSVQSWEQCMSLAPGESLDCFDMPCYALIVTDEKGAPVKCAINMPSVGVVRLHPNGTFDLRRIKDKAKILSQSAATQKATSVPLWTSIRFSQFPNPTLICLTGGASQGQRLAVQARAYKILP